MLNVSELPTEEFDAEQILKDLESGGELPPAGSYPARVEELVDVTLTKNKRVPQATVHFRIADGPFANRRVSFQRLWVHDIFRLLKSAGIEVDATVNSPRALGEAVEALRELNDKGKNFFKIDIDWEGFSNNAFQKALIDSTGAVDYEGARALAKSKDWDAARDAGNVHTTMTTFEKNGDNKYSPYFKDPVTGEELEARTAVKRIRSL